MRLRVNLSKNFTAEQPVNKNAILVILFMVALFFSSCSIFKPKPDVTTSRYPGQIYKSQRAKKPNLSIPKSSSGNPPFWYRKQRVIPKTLPPTIKPPGSVATRVQPSLPKKKFEPPEIFIDDLGQASLKKVILNQIQTMEFTDPSKVNRLADLMITHDWLKETLTSFLDLINENLPPKKFSQRIREDFVLHRVGKGKHKQVLFTGYYAPVVNASLTRTKEYRFPIYKVPEPSSHLQLVGHGKNYKIHGSSAPNAQAWRHYTRRQIDGEEILASRKLEIAWLKNDVDRFFLHIQGSGQLLLRDGTSIGVHFAGANNYKFGGLGKRMIADGLIKVSQGSMQGIKKYFKEYPEDIQKYFFQNKRYIFFKLSNEGGPRGSGGGELIGGRSIATDKKIYPAGGLAFVQLRKPILDSKNEIIRWKNFSRFVIDQDTGNAIRGKGRADFYFGIGDRAGAKAGHFYEWGDVFYIIKRVKHRKENS